MGGISVGFWQNKKKRRLFITLTAVFLAVAALGTACGIYLGTYYRADEKAVAAYVAQSSIAPEKGKNTTVFAPENATTGLIFYPGGKVEAASYEPLMAACAQRGILCVLVEMPFNLAVFDINAANGIREQYPQIENWYMGGHSLGGSMAASYVSKHTEDFVGLVLLGAYSTADLAGSGLKVLSVYGSEDQVMNREKYEKYRSNLPDDFVERVIDGGCHAHFGMYGAQKGDGIPTISNETQINITADAIADMQKG
jgi:hypothetical protein